MRSGAVKLCCRLERFKPAGHGCVFRPGHQCAELCLSEGFESPRGLERLIQPVYRLAAIYNHGGWKIQGIVKALNRSGNTGLQNVSEGHWFHSQYSYAFLHQPRNHSLAKTSEVVIEHVQRHLARIEVK